MAPVPRQVLVPRSLIGAAQWYPLSWPETSSDQFGRRATTADAALQSGPGASRLNPTREVVAPHGVILAAPVSDSTITASWYWIPRVTHDVLHMRMYPVLVMHNSTSASAITAANCTTSCGPQTGQMALAGAVGGGPSGVVPAGPLLPSRLGTLIAPSNTAPPQISPPPSVLPPPRLLVLATSTPEI